MVRERASRCGQPDPRGAGGGAAVARVGHRVPPPPSRWFWKRGADAHRTRRTLVSRKARADRGVCQGDDRAHALARGLRRCERHLGRCDREHHSCRTRLERAVGLRRGRPPRPRTRAQSAASVVGAAHRRGVRAPPRGVPLDERMGDPFIPGGAVRDREYASARGCRAVPPPDHRHRGSCSSRWVYRHRGRDRRRAAGRSMGGDGRATRVGLGAARQAPVRQTGSPRHRPGQHGAARRSRWSPRLRTAGRGACT